MSPRPGGESDKFGNRYEGAWTVQHLLRVLIGSADSITVEDIDELAEGAEFTFRSASSTQVHQLKRQHGNANSWTVKSLNEKGIWRKVRLHADSGRHFHFVSMLPSRPLQELSDRARRSADLAAFVNTWLTEELKDPFDELASTIVFGSADVAWHVLRHFWIEWPDERNINDMNAALAGVLLEGATGQLAAVGLGDLVQHNLGVRLDASAIEGKLTEYGLRRAQVLRNKTIKDQVAAITASWLDGIKRELLRPVIPRTEISELSKADRVILLFGDAGDGKSAVLQQFAEKLDSDGTAVLGFRLDRLDPFSTTSDLGTRLGLSVSPVTALSVFAGGRPAVLVVDQLDAVSLASGRMPRSFDAIADLIREASAFENIRVVLACRKFDVDNDHRIRDLVKENRSTQTEVRKLSDSQTMQAVEKMGLDPSMLSGEQLRLFSSPLSLVLLSGIGGDAGALTFRTINNLMDAFWERKRLECSQRREGSIPFTEIIQTVAKAMSDRQRLSVNVSVLDRRNHAADAGVLVSEHVLTRDGQQIAFFHEAFFGYVFARGWAEQNDTLAEFLLAGEQELFRRAQVRQVLRHMRDDEPERFVAEVEALLGNAQIRFHIKEVVLGILHALPDPTSAEWEMASRILDAGPPFAQRVWASLHTLPWFERLDTEGLLSNWLSGDDKDDHNHALGVMASAAKERPDRLAELLIAQAQRPMYAEWLMWVVRFANVHESRQLFDLLLDALRGGQVHDYGHSLWMFTYDLATHQPTWAVELLAVHLVLRPGSLALDDSGKVAALTDTDDAIIRLARQAAEGAPKTFCELLTPYLLTVMRLTEDQWKDHLLRDRHFSLRHPQSDFHELDDALLFSAAAALRTFAGQDPDAARPFLETLAADQHDAAQWLLYEGIRGAAAQHFAEWAAGLLQQTQTRFLSGYMSNGAWTSRQLLQAISLFLSDESFGKLEATILDLRFAWEQTSSRWYAFNLLSALEETRLSNGGRQRLGELRRVFGVQQPEEPQGITVGFVGSPIPAEAAQHMNDAQWLAAMAKHDSDREDFKTFRGGSHQLSQVLKAETIKAPERFARLALQLPREINAVYADGILMGLADAEPLDDPLPVFEAIRHISSLRLEANDRWLGWPLRRYLSTAIPDDIISLVIDRSLNAADPDSDRQSRDALEGDDRYNDRIFTNGINTARGHSAEILGDILVHDIDGQRTALVLPILDQLAQDTSIAVRSCVAHVIGACLRHARAEAIQAFHLLIQADDRLLATHTVERLTLYIGNGDPSIAVPVVERMAASSVAQVREVGGRLAAFAGIEWHRNDLLVSAAHSDDIAISTAVTTCYVSSDSS